MQHDRYPTGAHTKEVFRAHASPIIEDAVAGRSTATLLLVHLDELQNHHGVYGHAAHDAFYFQVIRRLFWLLGEDSKVTHEGGALAVCFAGQTLEGASLTAQRIQRDLNLAEYDPLPHENTYRATTTVSIAVAHIPTLAVTTYDALRDAAWDALEDAMRQGPDQISIATR